MHVPSMGQCRQHVEIAGGQTCQPEQGDPLGKVDERGVVTQSAAGIEQSFGGAGETDLLSEAAPQVRLPALFGCGRFRSTGSPRSEHVRTVYPVAVEQVGDVAHGGEPAQRSLGAGIAEVTGQWGEPGFPEVGVHHFEQRPDGTFGPPRVGCGFDTRRR